jgi:hypothetical protein
MHYGRWVYADGIGWVWVPGTTWAPAWVAWASGDDWVGWAPLPPDMGWNGGVSVSFTNFDIHRVPSRSWCFVDRRDLTSSALRSRILPVSRNVTILPRVQNFTRFQSRGGQPVNVGVDVRTIERVSGRPVPRMRLVDAQRPGNGHVRPGGNQLQMFRGRFAPAPANVAPRHMSARPDMPIQRDMRTQRDMRAQRDMPNGSASAAQNQQRQRFDLNQATQDRGPSRRPTQREWQLQRSQSNRADQVQQSQRNDQSRRMLEQDMRRQRMEQVPRERPANPAPSVDRSQRDTSPPRGMTRGNGNGGGRPSDANAPAPQQPRDRGNRGGRPQNGSGQSQKDNGKGSDNGNDNGRGNSDQPRGNGNGHGRDHGE